jgi:hypothetical protein
MGQSRKAIEGSDMTRTFLSKLSDFFFDFSSTSMCEENSIIVLMKTIAYHAEAKRGLERG